nr:GNAT family N-acetyltransferase [Nocardiopsis salina]
MTPSSPDAVDVRERERPDRGAAERPPRPQPRPARRSEVGDVAEVLRRAFIGDPVIDAFFPDADERPRRARRMFAVQAAFEHLPNGLVEVVDGRDGIVGAALWGTPGTPRTTRTLSSLRSAPHLVETLGLRRVLSLGTLARDCARLAPDRPYWYLADLGTDPDARGTGAGGALLRSGLGRADADALPVHLESSKAENIPIYEKFGFRVTGTVRMPDGPELYAMLREPARG